MQAFIFLAFHNFGLFDHSRKGYTLIQCALFKYGFYHITNYSRYLLLKWHCFLLKLSDNIDDVDVTNSVMSIFCCLYFHIFPLYTKDSDTENIRLYSVRDIMKFYS